MIHRETTDRRAAGRFALLAAALLWGTSFVILKNTLESVGTLWILAVRFTLAALLLGFFAGKGWPGSAAASGRAACCSGSVSRRPISRRPTD